MRLFHCVCLALAACGGSDSTAELSIEWEGEVTGRFSAPGQAVLCAQTGLVEMEAIRGDTGVAAVLFLSDSSRVAATDYPVFLAASYPEPRPGALAGLRWFDNVQVVAWEGLRGTIEVRPADSTLAGTFSVTMQQVNHPDTVLVTGRFSGIPLIRADSSCGAAMRRNTI